jgi:Tfp pilus assembly protein PilN
MKIRLNLATSPLENHRRFALGAALVGTVALVVLVLLSWHVYSARRAERALRAEIARLEKQTEQLRRQRRELEDYFNRAEIRKMRDRSGYLNGLIEQRSFPWTKIFAELEHILPDGVRVVSISPKMSEGRIEVKLVVGATGDESKLKFLRALEASKEFSGIQLLAETRPSRAGEADKVYLELVAAWYATT